MRKIYDSPIMRLALVAAVLLTAPACGSRSRPGSDQGLRAQSVQSVHSARIVVENETVRSGVHAVSGKAGSVWFPLDDVSESLGYRMTEQGGQYLIGDTDAAYALRLHDKRAYLGDTPVELPDSPTVVEGRPYLSTEALSALTGIPMRWERDRAQLVITPRSSQAAGSAPTERGGAFRSLAAGGANAQSLIAFAKQFLGTPYQFNAGPYEQTGKFDCSSFMRHVFKQAGVNLPRSSIQQANVGSAVADGQLRPGDLMFFYTPGRYRNNRIVGHVGMYIGDNRIIQTWGAPGVVISDFNAYWKKRFLFARRVL